MEVPAWVQILGLHCEPFNVHVDVLTPAACDYDCIGR